MLANPPQPILDVENEFDVLIWRFERLRAAGYEDSAASELAARSDVDLHLAVDLLARGCRQSVALRILL